MENVDIFVKSVSKCKNKEGSKERKVTDLSDIYNNLIQGEQSNFSRSPNSPPLVCTDTSLSNNATSSDVRSGIVSEDLCLNTQDEEILNILEELQCPRDDRGRNSFCSTTEKSRLSGHFVSETIFNLSRKVLSESEIGVLEKGLDFAPIQNKINEPELRRDFEQFCRRMRLRWHFRNEPTQEFSNIPAFAPKSSWNPPEGHPIIEVFLSQIEHELFQVSDKCLPFSNLTKEEWRAVRSLANDRSIVIKKADKGSCIVV